LFPQLPDIEGQIGQAGTNVARVLPDTLKAIRAPEVFIRERAGDIGTVVKTGMGAYESLKRPDHTRTDIRGRLGVTYAPYRFSLPNQPVIVVPELRIDLRLEVSF
jgi:hypothetical protein